MARRRRRKRRRTARGRCRVVTICKRPRLRMKICWSKSGRIRSAKKVTGVKRRRKRAPTKRRRTKGGYRRVSKKVALTRGGKLKKGCRAVRGGFMCKNGRRRRRR